MDKLTYQVKIGEEIRTYEEGTTYGEIAHEYQKFYDHEKRKSLELYHFELLEP